MRGEIALVACPIEVTLIGVAKAPDVAARPRPMAVSAAIANNRIGRLLMIAAHRMRRSIEGTVGRAD